MLILQIYLGHMGRPNKILLISTLLYMDDVGSPSWPNHIYSRAQVNSKYHKLVSNKGNIYLYKASTHAQKDYEIT